MNELNHCNYFVKRKKRYCRMTVKKGEKYCGEHSGETLEFNEITKGNNERIKCPLDGTHTCNALKLSKHLKVCNMKKLLDAQPTFIVKGINVEEIAEVPKHIPLSQVDNHVLDATIQKINAAYDKLPSFPEKILQHQILKQQLEDPSCGNAVRKHLYQNASLLAHLEHANLIQDNTCFIEFGAGKAKLAYWLAQVIKEKQNSSIILVDRSSHRHKSDNKLKNEECPVTVKRIRADIADLQLDDIPEVKNAKHKVGIAKHLCGAAIDLAIRSLIRTTDNNSTSNDTRGLVIAICCHHKCDYVSYVGKQYLTDAGFSTSEFPLLCSIASWATCGSSSNKTQQTTKGHTEINNQSHETDQRENHQNKLYHESERKVIGRKVKCLLNWGRSEFLKSNGLQSNLLYYTSTDISLENMCLVASNTTL